MDQLPLDMIRVIASFTTIRELGNMMAVLRDFQCPIIKRQKRFDWCKQMLTQADRSIGQGNCVDCMCHKLKAVCITIEDEHFHEPRVQPLSNYCSQHARQYLGVDLNDLINFVYVQ